MSSTETIVIETQPFEAGRHTVRACKDSGPCLIDGKPVYGTHRSMPVTEILSLKLLAGGHEIPLDASGMYNPQSPREDREFYFWVSRELTDRLVIRGEFSEGAAAYFGEWEIVEGSSVRTILKCVECLSMSRDGFQSGSQ